MARLLLCEKSSILCPFRVLSNYEESVYFVYSLQVKITPSRKDDKDSTMPNSMSKSSIPVQAKTPTEDKQTLEKKRLRILEQKLSQKLRQSNARRQIGKESGSIRKAIGKESGNCRELSLRHGDERPSSDSELIVKRNSSSRGLTPPMELVRGSDMDEEDGGLRTQLLTDIFKKNDKLEKVKQIQVRIICFIFLQKQANFIYTG